MFIFKLMSNSNYFVKQSEATDGTESGGSGGGEEAGTGGEADSGAGGGEEYRMTPERSVELKNKYASENGDLNIEKMLSDLDKHESSNTAPESYSNDFFKSDDALKDYELSDDDPILTAASAWAKENGVPQAKYEQLIKGAMGEIIKTNQALAQQEEAKIKELWDKIPDNEARRANALAALSSMVNEDLKQDVEKLVNHPVVFPVLDALLAKVRDPKINTEQFKSTPALGREDLQVMRVERDKAEKEGNRSLANQIQQKIDNAYAALERAGKL